MIFNTGKRNIVLSKVTHYSIPSEVELYFYVWFGTNKHDESFQIDQSYYSDFHNAMEKYYEFLMAAAHTHKSFTEELEGL